MQYGCMPSMTLVDRFITISVTGLSCFCMEPYSIVPLAVRQQSVIGSANLR